MKQTLKWLLPFIVLFFTSLNSAYSQEIGNPLTVEPIFPENHIQTVRGYFHLRVKPEDRQTVYVKLTNNLNEQQKVIIQPANGFTNPVGGMLYEDKLDSKDSVLLKDAIKLAPHLTVEQEVTLEPKEVKEIPITISVPNIDAGTILGAIRFITEGKPTEEKAETKEGEANFVIKTETVFAMAIQLDLPNKTTPNFALGEAGFTAQGPSIFMEMTNDSQMIQEGISGEYQVETSDGKQLFEGKITEFKMAPKSKIRYPISWNYETLEEGNYRLYVKMNVNNNEVAAEKPFTVGEKQIDEYVERTEQQLPQAKADNGIPPWIWAVGGAILAGGLMFWLGSRNKKQV